MAVVTDGLVLPDVGGAALLAEPHRRAVEVGQIGAGDLRGDAVFAHDRRVGVAFRAGVGRVDAEEHRLWITHAVDAVAVGAGGHVEVVLLDEGLAVHALLVLGVELGVTGGAALLHDAAVELPRRRPRVGLVRVLLVARVAGRAAHVLAAVHRARVGVLVDEEAELLAPGERHLEPRLRVTREAELVGDERGLRRVGDLGARGLRGHVTREARGARAAEVITRDRALGPPAHGR
jgi:hypothetical protein